MDKNVRIIEEGMEAVERLENASLKIQGIAGLLNNNPVDNDLTLEWVEVSGLTAILKDCITDIQNSRAYFQDYFEGVGKRFDAVNPTG